MSALTVRLMKILDSDHNLSEGNLEDVEQASETIKELETQLDQKWDSPERIVETINFLVNRLWMMGIPKEREGL